MTTDHRPLTTEIHLNLVVCGYWSVVFYNQKIQ
jgi:hypothetical protein